MTVIDFPAPQVRPEARRERGEVLVMVRTLGTPVLLTVHGEVDATKEANLGVALRNYAAMSKPFVIDISSAEFLSVGVFRVLLDFNDYCRGVGATWALVADDPALRRILAVVDPDDTLPVASSVGDVFPAMAPGTERC